MAERQSSRRVVVTGLGVVSSIGQGRKEFWHNLLAGKCGTTVTSGFAPPEIPVRVAGEVTDFDPGRFIAKDRLASYGRGSQLGIAAARLALEDAGLDPKMSAGEEMTVLAGSTNGECDVQNSIGESFAAHGYDGLAVGDLLKLPDNLLTMNIVRELGLSADGLVFSTACASGNYTIGYGCDLIRLGRASVALAGGCDAFSRFAHAGFARMYALTPDKCRPFDKNRKGIVVGEGAAFLVLESLEHAQCRKARIYAELLGYAMDCHSDHMTIPLLAGVSAVMDKALKQSGIRPEDVSLICAHGTGTVANDKTECEAIRQIFGERAGTIPVVSIKSMLGHTMGAASAIESVASVLAIHEGKIPPTIHFETPDEECPVDCVANCMREAEVNVVLNNAFAFGANNAATVFAKMEAV